MDNAIAAENVAEAADEVVPIPAIDVRSGRDRETMLMWCISLAFGAGMLALLIAMCAAEVSIHRNRSGATVLSGEVLMDR